MTMNMAAVAPTEAALRATCRREHPRCFACSETEVGGLGLKFIVEAGGAVAATWTCPAAGESYPGIVHGGLVATLLDAGMAHALFARDIVAQTGELTVRFRNPALIGSPVVVRAWLRAEHDPLFQLAADLRQGGSLCATARAKFMRRVTLSPGNGGPP